MSSNALTDCLELVRKLKDLGFPDRGYHGDVAKFEQALRGELRELEQARTPEEFLDEIGDVLYLAVVLAATFGIDPETALRHTVDKVRSRQEAMVTIASLKMEGAFAGIPPEEKEDLWTTAKILLTEPLVNIRNVRAVNNVLLSDVFGAAFNAARHEAFASSKLTYCGFMERSDGSLRALIFSGPNLAYETIVPADCWREEL